MFCSELLEVMLFVFSGSDWGAKDDEASVLRGELHVADPNFGPKVGDVVGLVSGCVPYSRFPAVKPDSGVGFQVLCQ